MMKSKLHLLIGSCLFLGACGSSVNDHNLPPESQSGSQLFKKHCVLCHGIDGKMGLNGAKDLSISTRSLDERKLIISQGKNLMTPFGTILTAAEIEAVATYTISLNQELTK